MTTVFISYRHESQVHRNRVRELALRLRNEGPGLRVILDQLVNEEELHRGGPHEGWGIWSAAQADKADRVLIVAFESGDVAAIPRELRDYHRFDAMKDFADLLTWLTEGRRPALRQPEAPSPITTPL